MRRGRGAHRTVCVERGPRRITPTEKRGIVPAPPSGHARQMHAYPARGSYRRPPRLTTERLLLREWRDEDLDDVTAMYLDPEVNRHIGSVEDRSDCWRSVVAFHAGHWALRGFGLWVLRDLSDDAFVGVAGLMQPEGWPGVELAWALVRPAWGFGYASEAGSAAIEWGWLHLGLPEILGFIVPGNARSISAARGLGFSRTDRSIVLQRRALDIYRLPAPR